VVGGNIDGAVSVMVTVRDEVIPSESLAQPKYREDFSNDFRSLVSYP
jgi:hypothetical protein